MSKKKKNPVPKIGRSIKKGYQSVEFKPTKKFEKQFPKAAQKREAAIRRKMPPPPKSYLEQLKELGDRVRSGELIIRKIELPEGNLIDKVAVLSNLYDIENTSEILDVDIDTLDKAIGGGRLNRLENAAIAEQYYHLVRDVELQDLWSIDIENIEKKASVLTDALRSMGDGDNAILFREAVGNQDVDFDKFEKGVTLFKNLTVNQTSIILDEWAYQVEHDRPSKAGGKMFSINEMFDNYFEDDANFWDVEDSTFWAWFREIFYS